MKATIWKNTSEKGDFYTVDLSRSYKQGDEWKETTKGFSGLDLFKATNLLTLAYNRINELRASSTQDSQQAAPDAATGSHEDAYEIPAE
jgi:hypothetical protein